VTEFKSSEIGADPLFTSARDHVNSLIASGLTLADVDQVLRWERILLRLRTSERYREEPNPENIRAKLNELKVAEVSE
jgi:hypothetical protein